MRLSGKVAIVTGGGSGIGRATVRRLAVEGAAIEILDRQDAAEACAEIAIGGGQAIATVCDVTNEGQIAAAARTEIAGEMRISRASSPPLRMPVS